MFSPNVRYQTTDPGISENTKQENCQTLNLGTLFSDYRKSMLKGKGK